MTEPEDLCLAGFYCNGSAKVPNPPYANCPIGHFCVKGSYIPVPCPRGSFANSERNKNVSDCKPCSPGYYCDPNATIVEERPCDAGFVCILGKDRLATYLGGFFFSSIPQRLFITTPTMKKDKLDQLRGFFS